MEFGIIVMRHCIEKEKRANRWNFHTIILLLDEWKSRRFARFLDAAPRDDVNLQTREVPSPAVKKPSPHRQPDTMQHGSAQPAAEDFAPSSEGRISPSESPLSKPP